MTVKRLPPPRTPSTRPPGSGPAPGPPPPDGRDRLPHAGGSAGRSARLARVDGGRGGSRNHPPTVTRARILPVTPVATGERLIGQHAFRPLFEAGAMDVCQVGLRHRGSMSRQPQPQRADPIDVGLLAPERNRDRVVVFDDDARVAELQGTQLDADRSVARHP